MLVRRLLAVTGVVALFGVVQAPVASAQTINVVSASTAMTSTTTFTAANATATCPAGSTLTGGGDELTRSGAPVTNDGNVTLGLYPTDAGTAVANDATDPTSWTATAGYSGQAPGLDTVTSFALCSSDVTSATEVIVATTGSPSLGPITAACPANTSLVGGGGGYTAFVTGDNTKIFDSYPSDPAGDVPASGVTNPTAWTLQGNSNSASGPDTTALAICATDATVNTVVATGSNSLSSPAGGASVSATATCPAGDVLLAGGSDLTDNPSGPGTGGQGVHVIGDYPSDSSANPIGSGSAGSWTVIAQNGGQSLTSLGNEALALCDTSGPAPEVPESRYPVLMVAIGAALVAGYVLWRRRGRRPGLVV